MLLFFSGGLDARIKAKAISTKHKGLMFCINFLESVFIEIFTNIAKWKRWHLSREVQFCRSLYELSRCIILASMFSFQWEQIGRTGRKHWSSSCTDWLQCCWGGKKVRLHLSTHLPLCLLQGQMARHTSQPRQKRERGIQSHSIAHPTTPSP